MDKKIIGFVISLLFMFLLIVVLMVGAVFAITGAIGNARMVLRATQGDSIEKYILVKNVNNVSLDIELSASGDLEKYVTLEENKFSLAAGEEKKAYFTIKVAKEGTTETKINVKFTPAGGKNGVGLSSTIIVIAEKGEVGNWFDWVWDTGENEETNSSNENNESGVSVTTGKVVEEENKKISLVAIALSITGIILLVFIILLVIAFIKTKKRNKKEEKIKLKKSTKRNE